MVREQTTDIIRINARKTDAFDVFNCKYYVGPNPYLNTMAFVFDFTLTGLRKPLPIEDYVSAIADRYPHLADETYNSYAELFARTVLEVSKLDMGLHLNRWGVKAYPKYTRIGIHAIHDRTSRAVVYFVWDWFEAISQDQEIEFDRELRKLQQRFRDSVYGGPTVYALLQTSNKKGIPTFYLWDERLMQYGYGKKQVRGVATTFDHDSHLDSDFTTRKDDCKALLDTLGFPVPKGAVVFSCKEALAIARDIGYPVAVKPVVGHKGIGVTADIQNRDELEVAYERALQAIPETEPIRIIVEKSISGVDFRLLCVNGQFVAAIERRPASVVGDGYSTIAELIEDENRKTERLDLPTSPMSKIQQDEAMEHYLKEQGLSLNSVVTRERVVYLRKVANLSAGGVSIDATRIIHPDNVVLAQDIAQHFRLTCLGIDIIAHNLSESWKSSSFAILEINAAPGILMHLNPAVGESVDVPSYILETFFESSTAARIPIITFNRLSVPDLREVVNNILSHNPHWTIGAVCRDAVFINHAEKTMQKAYNTNVQTLLRCPKLDVLIAEYDEKILEKEGILYDGSNIVVLDNPTETEMMLARDVFHDSTIILKKDNHISVKHKGLMEEFSLEDNQPFSQVYLHEISKICLDSPTF